MDGEKESVRYYVVVSVVCKLYFVVFYGISVLVIVIKNKDLGCT